MSEAPQQKPFKRFLEPSARVSEVLFGLIMVLTFTGSLSVAEAGREDIHTMLIGALGCNFAWGIIDAILYVMGSLAAQGSDIRAQRALKKAQNSEAAHQVIAGVMPPFVASTLGAAELEALRQKLEKLPEPPHHPRIRKEEWLAALGVFLWVFITTFPVTIPFILMHDVAHAKRISNVIAIVSLFGAGYAFGRCSEYRPWLSGLSMVALGGVLVWLTMALGG